MSNKQPDAPVTYMLDTNLLRYLTGKDSNQAELQRLKESAEEFWTKSLHEVRDTGAAILLPQEVVRELSVQMHVLPNETQEQLNRIIASLEKESFDLSSSLEYELRKFSSYAIQKYQDQIRPRQQTTTQGGMKDYKLEYLQTSDARILVSAYLNDAILVTRNIKDFIVYLLFCAPEEKRLYDFVEKQFVTVPAEGLELVAQDPHFQEVRAKLEHLLIGEE
ncbi:PIN domain-containing protein [Saccharibacillus alkalitolerans]|uniref:DUF4411 family protein n=1 Tax=Saccharibacillus alkalitolerans TaxID=2705290 RepID=A0ABX0F719_9BACL|nr:DUF4411 family protein [Saccharibacillus alkalitolerans]NGZ74981.1 DUF4411 family protein [Saccharibacillus alkalitolerans]